METSSGGYYGYSGASVNENIKLAKGFTCKDCGHSHDKPYPPLPKKEELPSPKPNRFEALTCYVSKLNFLDSSKEVFGFGVAKGGSQHNPSLTSPCEFMTLDGFTSLSKSGKVESVMREELHFFLPMYINQKHATLIKKQFEDSCSKMVGKSFQPSHVLQVLPKLLNSTVVTFMNGTTHTSERALEGYFLFHQLFLWAVQEYKDLLPEINGTIKDFVQNPQARMKKNTPNVGEWLALLTVATDFVWQDAASAYLQENFERNVMWYLKDNPSLANTKDSTVNASRGTETFRRTEVSRNLLAFQVLFLDIARPQGLSLKDVQGRYEGNYGFPTEEMQVALKEAVKKIKSIKNYNDWFSVIKVKVPSDEELKNWLISSVESASKKDGYFDKKGGGGRGGGGRGGGGGGGGRGRGGRY